MVGLAVERGAGAGGELEREPAGGLDRAGRGDTLERAVDGLAGERPPDGASSRAARISGSVGVPSRRSTPGAFPVVSNSPVQSRMSSAIWKATPRARPKAPSSGLPPPSTQAASKSFPVFSEQRAM